MEALKAACEPLPEVVSVGQEHQGTDEQQSDELGIYMPLVSALYDVIYNKKTIKEVVGAMMFSEQNRDVEFTVQ